MGAALQECSDGGWVHWMQEESRNGHDNRVRIPESKAHKGLVSCAMTQQEEEKKNTAADRQVFSVRTGTKKE